MARKNIPPGAMQFTLPMTSEPGLTSRPNPVVRRPAVQSGPLPDQTVKAETVGPMSFKPLGAGIKAGGGAVSSPSIFPSKFSK
jgi:hypothetical protein